MSKTYIRVKAIMTDKVNSDRDSLESCTSPRKIIEAEGKPLVALLKNSPSKTSAISNGVFLEVSENIGIKNRISFVVKPSYIGRFLSLIHGNKPFYWNQIVVLICHCKV